MGIHLSRSFSISLILSLSSLHFVLVLLLPDLSPRSFFLSMLPCLIFYFVFLSGVQPTCTANPEQVFPSPLSDYLQLHLTTHPPASSHSASANCPSYQFLTQFASPNRSPDHPNHFTSRTSTPILSQMPCTISVYDPLQYASFSPSSFYHLLSHLLCPGVHSYYVSFWLLPQSLSSCHIAYSRSPHHI